MNVGASKPSDYGLYFQWGDTLGYTADQVGKDKQFAEDYSDYKWYDKESFTKYTTTGDTLELEDDAAHQNMGGDWHMPSPDQFNELIVNTTSTWTTQGGVNGRLFTSKKDGSKSIFFPAAGYAWNGLVYDGVKVGTIQSSMLSSDEVDSGQYLVFYPEYTELDYDFRYRGFSVRGIIG